MAKQINSLLPLRIVKFINVVLITIPFALGWYFKYIFTGAIPFDSIKNPIIIFLFVCFYVTIGKVYDAFLVSLNRISEMIYSQVLAVLVSDALVYLISVAYFGKLQNPLPYLAIVFGQFLMSILWSVLSHHWYFKTYSSKTATIIHEECSEEEIFEEINNCKKNNFESLIDEYELTKKFDIKRNCEAHDIVKCIKIYNLMERIELARVTNLLDDREKEHINKLLFHYGIEKLVDELNDEEIERIKDENNAWLYSDDDKNLVETVFIGGVSSERRNIILQHCRRNDISVLLIPEIGDIILSGARERHMFHLPILSSKSYYPLFSYLVLKRFFDILLSLIALIILSPVFVVTAIAVKSDGGPAFYKQERLTKGGKKFYIHKFRSMRVDAEKDGVARLSSGDNDDRITPVGRVIRKLRIDELPQLIDILQGNLSIVGPRPEREEIALQYEKDIPEFRLRLQAKAGLTGYAQVYGKYNTDPYNKLQMDLMYIAHPSLLADLRICLATVKILFMPESTEGVDENQITAIAGEEKELESIK